MKAILISLALCSCAAVRPACAVVDLANQACQYVTVVHADGTRAQVHVDDLKIAEALTRARPRP